MQTTRQIILTLIFFLNAILLYSQTSILGSYENQTGATERMGEIIELRPNWKVLIFTKKYSETILKNEGIWSVKNDSLFIIIGNETQTLKINNDSLISTFPIPLKDTILDNKVAVLAFSQTFWTKTINYFENGKIESKRSLKSISNISPDITPEGIWTLYYENGVVKASGQFKDGRKVGKWEYYSLDGNVKIVDE